MCVSASEIFLWLERGGKIATGGKNLFELYETQFRRLAVELERSGRLKRASDASVDAEEALVARAIRLRSNDPHVIALARVSGARVLFTEDAELMDDFRDTSLVSKRGARKGAIIQPTGTKEVAKKCLAKSPACSI